MEGGNSPKRAYVEKYADAVFASFTEVPFLTQLCVAKITQIGFVFNPAVFRVYIFYEVANLYEFVRPHS